VLNQHLHGADVVRIKKNKKSRPLIDWIVLCAVTTCGKIFHTAGWDL